MKTHRLSIRLAILGILALMLCFFPSGTAFTQAAEPEPVSVQEVLPTDKTVELPWIKGAFRHVMDPPGQKSDPKKRLWYVNDHCFFVDSDNTIHWFGITNPYPKQGSLYGPGTHLHVGHASARHPFGPWKEHKDAFTLPEDSKKFIGACYVMRHGDAYYMIVNKAPGLCAARSRNLDDWEFIPEASHIDLGPGTRDPCVVKQPDGQYFLYATAAYGKDKEFSAVALAASRDMKKWEPREPALVTDAIPRGMLESPFVFRRADAYYLFINHSHHQYSETIVFRSENPRRFDWDQPLCTLFTHAAEIFEHDGKTYLSHCGIEDRHWGRKTGLYLTELDWTFVDQKNNKAL